MWTRGYRRRSLSRRRFGTTQSGRFATQRRGNIRAIPGAHPARLRRFGSSLRYAPRRSLRRPAFAVERGFAAQSHVLAPPRFRKIKRQGPRGALSFYLVEAGGIEPPSEDSTSPALHAERAVCSRPAATRRAKRTAGPAGCELADDRLAAISSDPVIMTLHPRAQAQVGSGLGLKRPERRRRRWRLSFCSWISEESYPLGMRQAISRPPSKPMHPREACRRATWAV